MRYEIRETNQTAAERALEFVADNSVVGLGTGRAAAAFVAALGARVRDGLRVRGVPTSQVTAEQARGLGIPLITLNEAVIDVTVDGADEVDPELNLIKGYGGALVREKIVAASSKQLVILVGEEKLVPRLGARGKLPVEVVPFGVALCRRQLEGMGYRVAVRGADGAGVFVTDNGNHILDCAVPVMPRPAEIEQAIRAIPGVVGTGLFIGMAAAVLIDTAHGVEVRTRQSK